MNEAFVFVMTSQKIDLRFLQISISKDYSVVDARVSVIKDPETTFRRIATSYDVVPLHYCLQAPAHDLGDGAAVNADDEAEASDEDDHEGGDGSISQEPVTAAELPPPEKTKEWDERGPGDLNQPPGLQPKDICRTVS